MSKARDLADFISTGSILSDGTLETVEIDGVTATPLELNKLDGVTVTTDEINHLSGVTSAVQTQVDAKAPTASPTFTGTVDLDKITVNTASGTSGQVLTSGGSGASPTWTTISAGAPFSGFGS